MAGKTLKQRIGIDLGRRLPLEDGIRWAAENDVCVIDAQTDIAPNALETFDDARCAGVRELLEEAASISASIPCRASMSPRFHPSAAMLSTAT